MNNHFLESFTFLKEVIVKEAGGKSFGFCPINEEVNDGDHDFYDFTVVNQNI